MLRNGYVYAMARLCERPGCSVPADVSYGIDPEHLEVWLDTFGNPNTSRAGVLCLRHANAMVVPLGWMLDDRREIAPRLFPSPVVANSAAEPLQRPRRSARSARSHVTDDTLQLELDADAVAAIPEDPAPGTVAASSNEEPAAQPAGELESDPNSDGESVVPWQPVFDQRDDLSGLLRTRGSLLSRAFNGVPRDAIRES